MAPQTVSNELCADLNVAQQVKLLTDQLKQKDKQIKDMQNELDELKADRDQWKFQATECKSDVIFEKVVDGFDTGKSV